MWAIGDCGGGSGQGLIVAKSACRSFCAPNFDARREANEAEPGIDVYDRVTVAQAPELSPTD